MTAWVTGHNAKIDDLTVIVAEVEMRGNDVVKPDIRRFAPTGVGVATAIAVQPWRPHTRSGSGRTSIGLPGYARGRSSAAIRVTRP